MIQLDTIHGGQASTDEPQEIIRSSGRLRDHFDRVSVISLADRSDRRERLVAHLAERGLATAEDIHWQDGVDGRTQTIPDWWGRGAGAWGCRLSHWQTISAAQQAGVKQVLILEDDVCFHHRAAEWLPHVMALLPQLPEAWDLFFLGGQHLQASLATSLPPLRKGRCIHRAHAYVVHERAYARLLTAIADESVYQANPQWHVDHQISHGQHQGLWTAYGPAWWLAGQEAGESNISGSQDPRRWWQEGGQYWQLPFVCGDPQLIAGDWQPWLCGPQKEMPEQPLAQSVWLRDIARTAWEQGRLPTCALPAETLVKLWPGGIRHPQSTAELIHLSDYPAHGLFFHHPFSGFSAQTSPSFTY